MDNSKRQNDSDTEESSMDEIGTLEELLPDELLEIPTNDPGISRNNTMNTAGPLIPDSVTIPQGENEVYHAVSTQGFLRNASQMGRLEPQVSISSYTNSIESPGSSSFRTNAEHPIGIPSFCPNPPSYAVSSFHQAQQSAIKFPSLNQTAPFAPSSIGGNWHSISIPSVNRSQLPLIGFSNSYPAQPFRIQNSDQNDPTSTSSFGETRDSVKPSIHQAQPSLVNPGLYHRETLFGVSREDQNFSAEATNIINVNTLHQLAAVFNQPSIGFSPQGSSYQHSNFNSMRVWHSNEPKLQFYHDPAVSKSPLSEVDINGQMFSTSDDSKRHCSTNIDSKSFECNVCHKKFTLQSDLKRHSHIHCIVGPEMFKCGTCHGTFTRKFTLERHRHNIHGIVWKKFKCDQCDKSFTQKRKLKAHCCNVHSGEEPYKCNQCGRGFTHYRDLKDHYTVQTGKKPFKCNKCGAEFAFRQSWRRHYRKHHSGENKP